MEGVNFVHIRRKGLYFMCTTKFNVSPAFAVELLQRIAQLFKGAPRVQTTPSCGHAAAAQRRLTRRPGRLVDYCGVLTEESLRLNMVLVYELLDEVIDFGYAQGTGTEQLKAYVYNEPVAVPVDESTRHLGDSANTAPSTAADKSVIARQRDPRSQKSEVFVDLIERLTVLVAANGDVLRYARGPRVLPPRTMRQRTGGLLMRAAAPVRVQGGGGRHHTDAVVFGRKPRAAPVPQ